MIAVVTGNVIMSLNNHNQAKKLLNEKYYVKHLDSYAL